MRAPLLTSFALLCCLGCARTIRIEQRWHLAPWIEEQGKLDLEIRAAPSLPGDRDKCIVESRSDWQRIWGALGKPAPAVDFDKYVVIGVCLLTTADGTQGFFIDRIEAREGGAVVYVKKQMPPPGSEAPTVAFGNEIDLVMAERVKLLKLPLVFADDPFWVTSP
jgi:hypothetical protein